MRMTNKPESPGAPLIAQIGNSHDGWESLGGSRCKGAIAHLYTWYVDAAQDERLNRLVLSSSCLQVSVLETEGLLEE